MRKIIIIIIVAFSFTVNAQQKAMTFSMEEAVKYAIKNNFNTHKALNDLKVAEEVKWQTTTMGLPQINATVNYQNFLKQPVSLLPAEITGGPAGTFVPVVFGTQQNLTATVTLSQLIFDGSYLVGLQSAKTYLKISEQAKEKSELATREAVINAYGNVLVAEKSIEILKNNKKILEKNLSDTKKIYKNGLTELENVEQLQITLATVTNQLNSVIRLKDIAYKMLNVILGNPINIYLTLSDSLDHLVEKNIDLELITDPFLITNHIDFRIAENNRESKRLLLKLEKSKALPSLSAFVNYGSTANSNSFTFFNSNQQWFDSSLFGVNLNIPIFSSFGRLSRTQQARINLETSDLQLKETRKRLSLVAEQARSNYQLSIETYTTSKQNLDLAKRIELKQQIKFFEGLSTSFDLSQAQNQLYTQQNNYIQSMLDVISKKVALENALNIPIK